MRGQYIRNIDRQIISEEDTFLRLSRGDVKDETESEIIVAHDQAAQTNIMRQKYYKQKQIANVDSVNNFM